MLAKLGVGVHTAAGVSGRLGASRNPMAGAASTFLEHAHSIDMHTAVNGFAHVVDREQSHADCSQRFHFYARSSHCFNRSDTGDAGALFIKLEIDTHFCERKRMAEGNQIGCALGGLDGCNARNTQDVAFFRAAGSEL